MTTLLNGVLGGLVVGFLAAITIQFLDGNPSAPAAVTEQLGVPRIAASRWWQLALLSLYGGLAGGGFLALELFVLQVLGVPPSFGEALGVAIVWSGVLSVLWIVVGWSLPLLRLGRSHLGELLAYHLLYGLGFGIWIRFTWIT